MDQQNQVPSFGQQNTYSPQSQTQQSQPTSSIPPINTTSISYNSEKPRKFGLIIVIAIVVLIIIAVGIYLFASSMSISNPVQENITGTNTQPVITNQVVETQVNYTPQDITPITNNIDDINSLQKDLDNSINGLESQSI